MKHASEIVYVNGGEVYKAHAPHELATLYRRDPDGHPAFGSMKADGKRYFMTSALKAHYGGGEGVPLTGLDLCPAVTFWLCLGATTPTERRHCDLFFAVDSVEQLHQVARYYQLPFPATEAMARQVMAAPEQYCFGNTSGRPVIVACIKFVDAKPSLLKLYTYPKPFGDWDVWMYGAAYFDGGRCYEAGAVYQKSTGGADLPGAQMRHPHSHRKAEVIQSRRLDGVLTNYVFTPTSDPVLMWQGQELADDGQVLRTKRYESSDFVRMMIARMKNGPTFADYDLCPAVTHWLGRAWYDDGSADELLFAIESARQLEQVAAYYHLPVPHSAAQAHVLDNEPERYRARHYDLAGEGPGKFLPVVVGSVTFQGRQPLRLLLYTFLRPWEFAEPIELPWLTGPKLL